MHNDITTIIQETRVISALYSLNMGIAYSIFFIHGGTFLDGKGFNN